MLCRTHNENHVSITWNYLCPAKIATENFNELGEALLTDEVLPTSEKLCHVTKKSVTGCTIILAPNFNYCLNNDTKEHINQSVFFFFFSPGRVIHMWVLNVGK